MRVAMVSWEYPPLVVGGLAAHVHGLATAMARAGHEVVVLTRAHPYAPDDSEVEGVRVLRAHVDLPWVPNDNPLAQVISGNHQSRSSAPACCRGKPTSCTRTTGWVPGQATRCARPMRRRSSRRSTRPSSVVTRGT